MKVILINSQNRSVNELDITGDLKSIYDAMDVQMIETASYLDNGDVVYVDEEGMFGLDRNSVFFNLNGAHQPFAGNGLVIGTNTNTGESVDCKSTAEEIRTLVEFLSLREVMAMMG